MLKVENLKLAPEEPLSALTAHAARALKLRERDILSLKVLRRSVDAREDVKLVYTAAVEAADEAAVLRRLRGSPRVSVYTPAPACRALTS